MAENNELSYEGALDMLGKVNSMMKTLGDEASTTADQLQSILGGIKGLADLVPSLDKALNANGGVVSVVSLALGALAVLGDEFSAYMEQKRAENIQWVKAGADAVEGEFSYSEKISDVEAIRNQAAEGHLPFSEGEISLEEVAGYKEVMAMDGLGSFTEEMLGAVAEYDYQMYLQDLDRIIAEAKTRERDAWDTYVNTLETGTDEEKANAEARLKAAREESNAIVNTELDNAVMAYRSESARFFQELMKTYEGELPDDIKRGYEAMEMYREAGDVNGMDTWANILMGDIDNSGIPGKMFQYYMDSGKFQIMGLTDSEYLGPYEAANIVGFALNGYDNGAIPSQVTGATYGQQTNAVDKWYYRNIPTPEMPATAPAAEVSEAGNGQPYFSFAGGVYGEANEGTTIDLSSLIAQSLSSEEFGASLTTALTTAFASEDLWATLGETFNSGFSAMVESQIESFTEYGTGLGEAMTAGLAQGIDSGTARVCSSIRSMATRAVAEARKRLDINSPSRVFREIGLSTGEGFALGIDESLLLAENAAMRMAEGVARAGAGTNAGAGRGAVVNLNVNQPSIRSDDDVRRLSEEFARYTAAMTYGL